jgi:hypothetical protein
MRRSGRALQHPQRLPGVAGPGVRIVRVGGARPVARIAPRHVRIDRQAVVQHDQRVRPAMRLDIHEVAQRELEVMHAVDEGEINRPTEQRRRVLRGEEGIARHLEQMVRRLASRWRTARDGQRLARRGADLQIAPRPLQPRAADAAASDSRSLHAGAAERSVGKGGRGGDRGAKLERRQPIATPTVIDFRPGPALKRPTAAASGLRGMAAIVARPRIPS